MCYRVTYTYDNQGRRVVTPPDGESQKHLLLLGGSYVFGQGLSDEETLAYRLQELTGHNVVNYALSGVGPPFVLRQFEIDMIQPTQKQGVALLLLPGFHEDRISMNSSHYWLWKTPGYESCGESEVCSIGFQENTGATVSRFLKIYSWLRSNSKVLSHFGQRIHSKSRDERLTLMARIVKKIQLAYEERFQGPFFVVLMPDFEYPLDFLEALAQVSVPIIEIKDSQFQMSQKQVCHCDSHPSAAYMRYIADELIDQLKQRDVF